MKRMGKKHNDEVSDTVCLEVLSDVASQFGIDNWPDTVQGKIEKEEQAVGIARELHKDLKRLTGIDIENAGLDEPLTDTELRVLYWSSMGKNVSEMAAILSITERMARSAREQINKKFKSNSITFSVAKAYKCGLL